MRGAVLLAVPLHDGSVSLACEMTPLVPPPRCLRVHESSWSSYVVLSSSSAAISNSHLQGRDVDRHAAGDSGIFFFGGGKGEG